MHKSINRNLLLTTLGILCVLYGVKEAKGEGHKKLTDDEVREIREDILDTINYYRELHNRPALKTNDEIQRFAQNFAEKSSQRNRVVYNTDNDRYGESIAMFMLLKHVGEVAVDLWYYQMRFFKVGDDETKMSNVYVYDVTQMLWAKTTDVGIGVARNINLGHCHIVVNYDPRGRVPNEYKDNLPVINEKDINEVQMKWKKIEDLLRPGTDISKWQYITNDFPDGQLPGWQSTKYEEGKNIIEDSYRDGNPRRTKKAKISSNDIRND